MNYTKTLPNYGDLMTREDYIQTVASGFFIDYDGHGYPVKDNKMDTSQTLRPSQIDKLPTDCTHVIWFNK